MPEPKSRTFDVLTIRVRGVPEVIRVVRNEMTAMLRRVADREPDKRVSDRLRQIAKAMDDAQIAPEVDDGS